MTPNPIEVQKYLEGLDYPASKEEVISHAGSKGADQDVLDVLEDLPDRKYSKPTEISAEIGQM